MGGHIDVHSEVGKGSTFTVSIPLRIVTRAAVPQFERSSISSRWGMVLSKIVFLILEATVNILGSAKIAQEMITAFTQDLRKRYIDEVTALVHAQDRVMLRFILHQLLAV